LTGKRQREVVRQWCVVAEQIPTLLSTRINMGMHSFSAFALALALSIFYLGGGGNVLYT